MLARRSLLCATALVAACSSAPSLDEIAAEPDRWDGKTVTVEGWLGPCEGNECYLLPSQDDLKALADAKTDFVRADQVMRRRAIRVGYDEKFDRQAKPLQGRHVRLTGRVNASEWGKLCLDRCDWLIPVSVVSISE